VFGLATSGDVPEVVLQVPNAAAQMMAGPLFGRGVLCFEGGIGGDVLRHVFGPDDFIRKQIKAERGKEEEVKRKIIWETRSKSREIHLRIVRFFGGLLSWGCLPLSMALGFFPLETGEEMRSDG
jgi:hypothetical protein